MRNRYWKLLSFVAVILCNDDLVSSQDVSYPNHANLSVYRDDAGELRRIQSAEHWAIRRAHILNGMQQAMGQLPDRSAFPPLTVKVLNSKDFEKCRRETVLISAEKADHIPADVYFPLANENKKTRPAILALHPTGAPGKRIIAGESPRHNRQYGMELAERGYIVICPDYPSFGEYRDYDFDNDDYSTGTMKGIVNHMRCVDYLVSRDDVDANRIGVIGHSLGGHNAIFVGAFDQRLKVVVSSCGWTPFHDYYGGKIAGWTSDRYMPSLKTRYALNPDRVPFDFYELVAAIAPRPFFSNSPVGDSNFDVNGVRKAIAKVEPVFDLLQAPKNLHVVYPPCGHDFPTEIREQSYAVIDSALKHDPLQRLNFADELPRAKPLSPTASLASLKVQPGFEMQLAACEPQVVDPVAVSYDHAGRMYVVEMRGYSEQDNELLGRVRVLEDLNRDGHYETAHVFADGFSWPTAIICYDNGIFVGAAPDIWYLQDTDGDFKADIRRRVFTGFGKSNVQGLLNSFRWGLDNRIHGAASSAGGQVKRVDAAGKPVSVRGRDFSFDPRTLDFRTETGGAQHGMCFDDWGRKFVCSNSDHAQAVIYNDRYLSRAPKVRSIPARQRIADDGGQAPVFRSSPVEPWRIVRTRLRVAGTVRGPVEGGGTPAGYFTGATGITVYRGDAWSTVNDPDNMLAIVGDVGSNIIHRKTIVPKGYSYVASRIDQKSELVASPDTWFRPVQFANAPDGCLHILDMYREVIEHPASLPPQIKQHLDLTSGRDRGRIYRLAPAGFAAPSQARTIPDLSKKSHSELVNLLNSANAWQRTTASRLLFERSVKEDAVLVQLRELTNDAQKPVGCLHALYLLKSLQTPNAADLLTALETQNNPRVLEHAVRLSEAFATNATIQNALAATKTKDARLQLQLAFSFGAFPDEFRLRVLPEILRMNGGDPWLRMAALTSAHGIENELLSRVLSDEATQQKPFAPVVIAELLRTVRPEEKRRAIEKFLQQQNDEPDDPLRLAATLVDVAATDSIARAVIEEQKALTTRCLTLATNTIRQSKNVSQRRMAIRILQLGRFVQSRDVFSELLSSREPADIQQAALETMAAFSEADVADFLIERWNGLSPEIREDCERVISSRSDWSRQLIQAIQQQRISKGNINVAQVRLWAKSRDAKLKAAATQLLNEIQTTSRAQVVTQYKTALDLVGDAQRGAGIFKKTCAGCHKLDKVGYAIGPNLATMKRRGREAILLNVLDPNREVNPAYLSFVAETENGRTHTGMIASESPTSIVLRQAENKDTTLLRQQLENLTSTGLSLMPEGLEKQISPQGMADLLEYLDTVR